VLEGFFNLPLQADVADPFIIQLTGHSLTETPGDDHLYVMLCEQLGCFLCRWINQGISRIYDDFQQDA